MIDLRLVSCLEKVFEDEEPRRMSTAPEALKGEECAFQLAWRFLNEGFASPFVRLHIESTITHYIRIYHVKQVPVSYPWIPCDDSNYLRTAPGLYPDPLIPWNDERLRAYSTHWESLWIEIIPDDTLSAGVYPIKLSLTDDVGVTIASVETQYTLYNVELPPQKLIHTRWFHCDALSNYYNVDMFSEEFWRICENFVRAASNMSINCLLTPVHTPPLDTRIGGERVTCQLVDIEVSDGHYYFNFEKLERWIHMAERCGIDYFEIAHLFTQWGAAHAPKIMAKVNGEQKRIFGWETDAGGSEYIKFLNAYIPALKHELNKLGVLERCFFHISDEPGADQIDAYLRAREGISEALKGLNVIDALSNIDFYLKGAVTKPIPASTHIQPFLDAGVKDLWTYYCIGQFKDVSNVFIAMPAARTRFIGIQMFKYGIKGLLQWGFNFYSSQYSDYAINPWLTNDGDGFSPAGDCFIVYPSQDGNAYPSLRSKLIKQAIQDMCALDGLAGRIGYERTVGLIEEGVRPITFSEYPTDNDYILKLRHRVNETIAKCGGK